MASRATKLQTMIAHSATVNCCEIGRKTGKIIATGADDRHVNIWSIGNPNALMCLSGHTSGVDCVTFDPAEEVVASGSASGAIKLFDLTTGKVARSLKGHPTSIRSLAVHPYGDFLCSGSLDTTIKVWDCKRRGCIQTYKQNTDIINTTQFSPDGRWIVSGSDDGMVKIWDLTAGKLLHEFKDHAPSPVTALQFHPNEFLLASAGADRTVKFWDLERFELISTSPIEASRVRCIGFDEEGQCLFSGGRDSLRVYGWEPAECYDSMQIGWGKVADLHAPDTSHLIGASFYQNSLSIWSVDLKQVNLGSGTAVPAGGDTFTAPMDSVAGGRPATSQSGGPSIPAAAASVAAHSSRRRPPTSSRDSPATRYVPPDDAPLEEVFAGKMRLDRDPPASSTPTSSVPAAAVAAAAVAPSPVVANAGLGLDLNEFLPQDVSVTPSAAPQVTASDVISSVATGHSSMIAVMSNRLKNIKIVRSHWTTGRPKEAMDLLAELGDNAVTVDVLNVMILKPSLWSLDVAVSLLPHFGALLESQYENYVIVASNATQLILKSFGQVILANLNRPPGGLVDISREERYEKCSTCYRHLKDLQSIIQPRLRTSGKIGSSLRQLDKVLSSI